MCIYMQYTALTDGTKETEHRYQAPNIVVCENNAIYEIQYNTDLTRMVNGYRIFTC